MEFYPVISSLRKHKSTAALIILETALACAVLFSTLMMIEQHVAGLHMKDAIDESSIVIISVTGVDPSLVRDDIARNLASLHEIPGVRSAAASSSVPFGSGYGTDSVSTDADGKLATGASRYMFTQGGGAALGLRLIEGRFFNEDEYADSRLGNDAMPTSHSVVITHSLARHLWFDKDPLGKQLWLGDSEHSYTVVGVISDVARPGARGVVTDDSYYSIFFPLSPDPALTNYIVRSSPNDRDEVLRASVNVLQKLSQNAVIKGSTFDEIRDEAQGGTRSIIKMLILVAVVMLVVTSFGTVGLTSFWIRQRRRQIGIRRALGATGKQILHYFQLENFLLSSAGVAVGIAIVFGMHIYLLTQSESDKMTWYFLPVSAFVIWILGQIAVFGPALRASKTPPAVATRS